MMRPYPAVGYLLVFAVHCINKTIVSEAAIISVIMLGLSSSLGEYLFECLFS